MVTMQEIISLLIGIVFAAISAFVYRKWKFRGVLTFIVIGVLTSIVIKVIIIALFSSPMIRGEGPVSLIGIAVLIFFGSTAVAGIVIIGRLLWKKI